MVENDHFMTAEEVAQFLLIQPKTLANWRSLDPPRGPKFRRFGNRPRYKHSDAVAWADEQGCEGGASEASARSGKQREAKARRQAELEAIERERDELWQRIAALNAQQEALG